MPFREIALVIHLLGFGFFVAILTSGLIIESHYRKAVDVQTKATFLRALRPIGLLSPLTVLIILITGIGNMHVLGLGLFDSGWLTAKIIFFAMAVTNGALSGVRGRKRGILVEQMAKGEAPPEADAKLKEYDKQQLLFYFVNTIFLLIIVSLSVYRRVGGGQ